MRLGLLAAARITRGAVVEPATSVDGVELSAVAARDTDRARAAADEWGIPRWYGSYDDLIGDPELDAIYIATPAALHCEWTIAALEAGKHVLCEKPLASNATEARRMVDAARAADRVLMEAFHWRYHPMVEQWRTLVDAGAIGELREAHARFLIPDGRIARSDIRWILPLGGGALMDLGCYAVQWVRVAAGGEPTVRSAEAVCPVPGIDGALTAALSWTTGVTGSISCSMIHDGEFAADLVLVGTDAILTATSVTAPQHGATLEVRAHGAADTTTIPVDGPDTTSYFHQLVAFRDAVRTGVAPPTSGDDSIATMAIIDACYRAAGLVPRPSRTG